MCMGSWICHYWGVVISYCCTVVICEVWHHGLCTCLSTYKYTVSLACFTPCLGVCECWFWDHVWGAAFDARLIYNGIEAWLPRTKLIADSLLHKLFFGLDLYAAQCVSCFCLLLGGGRRVSTVTRTPYVLTYILQLVASTSQLFEQLRTLRPFSWHACTSSTA